MMNKFIQHVPSFVSGVDPTEFEFDKTDELLSSEYVSRFSKNANFSHFAMSDNRLMSISDNGFHWWVVGFISDPESVDLPKWEGWKFRASIDGGPEVILGKDEVWCSCGKELSLRDGRTAINLDW